MPRDDEEPQYTIYRSRPRLFGRREEDRAGDRAADGLRELRDGGDRAQPQPAPYTRRGGRRGLSLPGRRRRPKAPGVPGGGRVAGLTVGRVVKWLVLAVLGWSVLSLVLFLVS